MKIQQLPPKSAGNLNFIHSLKAIPVEKKNIYRPGIMENSLSLVVTAAHL